MNEAQTPSNHETVGLLFVHGIGQQKPFEHLTRSVSEIAELLKRDGKTACTVVDRTAGWKGATGAPTAMGEAPVTFNVKVGANTTRFECHEVYWADLGARDGVLDTIAFWFWGLGQWAAPVYREFDAAQLDKSDKDASGKTLNRQATSLARLPKSVAGYPADEFKARLQLAIAGLGALLTLVSWSLVKRIGAALFKMAPSPSILVQYIGDVRTYEESARPGDTALSDPGFPRRVGIRRRMVSQMVAMGNRAVKGDFDRWYVLGHSLGSVVAYNGLTEIGHTLPNYLGEDQWNGLEADLTADPGCAKRGEKELPFMMPARPPWLTYGDVINRRKLFERLSGILTYGSPLNKFAGLWPRIVATATDREDKKTVFPSGQDFRWINIRAPLDPVSGNLDRYGARNMGPSVKAPGGGFVTPGSKPMMPTQFDGFVPRPETYTTPFWQPYLLAHLNYFRNQSAFASGYPIDHRYHLARWLLHPGQKIAAIAPLDGWRKFGIHAVSVMIVVVVLILATIMITLAGGIGRGLFTADHAGAFDPLAAACNLVPVLVVGIGILLLTGLVRWRKESLFNRQLAEAMLKEFDPESAGAPPGLRKTNPDKDEVKQQLSLHARQFIVARRILWLFLPVMFALVLCLFGNPAKLAGLPWPQIASWALVGLAECALMALAMRVQSLVNLIVPPLKQS